MTDNWFKRTFDPGAVMRAELETRVEALTSALAEREQQLAVVVQKIREAESAIQLGDQRLQESESSAESLRSHLRSATEQVAGLNQRLASAEEGLAKAHQEAASARSRIESIQKARAVRSTLAQELSEKLDQATKECSSARLRGTELEKDNARLTAALADNEGRLASATRELAEAETVALRYNKHLQESQRSVESLKTKLHKATACVHELEQRANAADESLSNVRQEALASKSRLEEFDKGQAALSTPSRDGLDHPRQVQHDCTSAQLLHTVTVASRALDAVLGERAHLAMQMGFDEGIESTRGRLGPAQSFDDACQLVSTNLSRLGLIDSLVGAPSGESVRLNFRLPNAFPVADRPAVAQWVAVQLLSGLSAAQSVRYKLSLVDGGPDLFTVVAKPRPAQPGSERRTA